MRTALVAEDDADIQKLVTALLSERGFDQVLCASTAKQALELAGANQLDFVVLDYYLADGPALEVADALRALPDFGAPILVTTALPRAQAREVCDEAEACEC